VKSNTSGMMSKIAKRMALCMSQKQPLRILFPRARDVAPSPANAPVNSPAPANGYP
jgi:hypothetical protein